VLSSLTFFKLMSARITCAFKCAATTGINTPSLHDALPISVIERIRREGRRTILLVEHKMEIVLNISDRITVLQHGRFLAEGTPRSEEHTSELQSRENLVCRLLLEKKNRTNT